MGQSVGARITFSHDIIRRGVEEKDRNCCNSHPGQRTHRDHGRRKTSECRNARRQNALRNRLSPKLCICLQCDECTGCYREGGRIPCPQEFTVSRLACRPEPWAKGHVARYPLPLLCGLL